jgi:UDP-N-acetylmuramoylalanine--D-glutamate ligase
VSLAARAAEVCGVDADIVKKLITEFKGVKGRLELIKETSGVRIYNDTTATTGDAAVAGLLAVRDSIISSENQSGKIIFITGGRDKELDMTRYLETIQKLHDDGRFKKVIFLQDETTTGTNRVLSEVAEAGSKYTFQYETASSIELAVQTAKEEAISGDVLLFSPGFASFGMFQNEYDRGDRFVAAVSSTFL